MIQSKCFAYSTRLPFGEEGKVIMIIRSPIFNTQLILLQNKTAIPHVNLILIASPFKGKTTKKYSVSIMDLKHRKRQISRCRLLSQKVN